MLAKEYTPILIVVQASIDLGVKIRYLNDPHDDGLCIIVYINGKTQLDTLFTCTISVDVKICSVRFISMRANAEKMADNNCNEHPIRLSLDGILSRSLIIPLSTD